jgi:hypothetical protein
MLARRSVVLEMRFCSLGAVEAVEICCTGGERLEATSGSVAGPIEAVAAVEMSWRARKMCSSSSISLIRI